jgi:hypothetical protein
VISVAQSLAIIGLEVSRLRHALPSTLGPAHPDLAVLDGALDDVSGQLLVATASAAASDEDDARAVALTQLRALESLRGLISGLAPAPVEPQLMSDDLEMISGLLEIVCGAPPSAG